MSTQRALSLTFLATSLLMLWIGYRSDDGTYAASGDYAASTAWYWAIGAVCAAAGAVLLQLGERSDRRQARKATDTPTRALASRHRHARV